MKKLSLTLLLLIFSSIIIYGCFFYLPFLRGEIPGVYHLALLYNFWVNLIFAFLILFLPSAILVTPLYAIAIFLRSRYDLRQKIKRILFALSSIPLAILIILAFASGIFSLDFGGSLTIEPWQQTYFTAYKSNLIENRRFGTGLIFQCDRRKIICRQIYSFSADISTLACLWSKYDRDRDRFLVEYSRVKDSKTVIYARSKHEKLMEAQPPLF